MLDTLLKENIERYCHRARETNPLFVRARKGELSPQHIHTYLTNVLFLIRHTPPYLQLARQRSAQLGLKDLEAFYASKLGEEQGHDAWAESDISKLKQAFRLEQAPPGVSASMRELVLYLETVIERDPALYLPYILLAEYSTVLIGPSFLNDLREKCGIPPEMMSVIGNHAELDRNHVIDDLAAIGKLLESKKSHEPFLDVFQHSSRLYEQFCRDISADPGERKR